MARSSTTVSILRSVEEVAVEWGSILASMPVPTVDDGSAACAVAVDADGSSDGKASLLLDDDHEGGLGMETAALVAIVAVVSAPCAAVVVAVAVATAH